MKKLLILLLLIFGSSALAQEHKITIEKITPKVWVHTSYKLHGNNKVPSNGLIISTSEGVVLIDTAWGEEQTVQLMEWISENLQQQVKLCIISHAHDDRMGGIKVLQKQNVEVIGSEETAEIATEYNLGNLTSSKISDTTIVVGKQHIQVYYPGPGHAPDNLVVFLPKARVLFGGCLVKEANAQGLGNTTDADLSHWPIAIRNVQQKFPKANVVVPGHGLYSGPEALTNTLQLLAK